MDPEAAAAAVQRAEQTMGMERKHNDYYTVLPALRWAHTPDARKVVERLAEGKDAVLREAAEKTLQKW